MFPHSPGDCSDVNNKNPLPLSEKQSSDAARRFDGCFVSLLLFNPVGVGWERCFSLLLFNPLYVTKR
jgi:hypothetical protein